MKNNDKLVMKINNSLEYLFELDEKLKPVLDYLTERIRTGISSEELSVKEAFDMWMAIQEQHTNSILLQAKLEEIIQYNHEQHLKTPSKNL